MPIYEYACGSCEHRFETIQRVSEAPLRDCPECGDGSLKKLLSAPVFRFKGSGWYETDFKTGDKRNIADASDGGDGDKSNGDDAAKAKGDTKEAGAQNGKSDGGKSNGKGGEGGQGGEVKEKGKAGEAANSRGSKPAESAKGAASKSAPAAKNKD